LSNINTAAISGNLTRDPELRHTPSGLAICKLRLASNRSKKNQDGDGYVEETTFIDATVFSGFGELVARKVRKGDRVTVVGRLSSSEWEAEDGSKRSKIELIVNDLDGDAMFKKDSDVPALEGGEAKPAAQQTTTAAAAADDDIPF
jgi:single-strand DNA-binding protein